MTGLNVVALISGGKDSFFSILHCQANGHNVVALANLHPSYRDGAEPVDDLDSYMYQTIGHAVIPLYEEALGLPLYRQEIDGAAVNHNKSYQPLQGPAPDETESLLPLLRKVLVGHPEVNAVSTGAILSDYQRTRVESVSLRLGLIPLSYLWQWPLLPPNTTSSLLQDMAAVGQDSRIVKVASGGLDASFLWRNVSDSHTIERLVKAASRFGIPGDGAVLGEGGEFETLVISGPGSLWRGDISVAPEDVHIIMGEAGSASVRISNVCVRPRIQSTQTCDVRMPLLLEDDFHNIYEALAIKVIQSAELPAELTASSTRVETIPDSAWVFRNLSGLGDTAVEQTRSIMETVMAALGARDSGPNNIAYAVIILRNMEDFAAVNAVYGSYFLDPNPPARATIACAGILRDDQLVTIDFTCTRAQREGLHVQSRSYWAPANIGPYSQAVKFPAAHKSNAMDGAVYIAGQIPLVPATMELPRSADHGHEADFAMQTCLALQHLYRIGRTMKLKHYLFGVALIADPGETSTLLPVRVNMVRRAWYALHEATTAEGTRANDDDNDEEFDVWHQKYGAGNKPWLAQERAEADEEEGSNVIPPLMVISVDSLPRNVGVEWIGYGKTFASHDTTIPIHLQGLLEAFRGRILWNDMDSKL